MLSLTSNDPRSPFFDQTGAPMKPIAKLHLTRQRLYEKSCSEEEGNSESTGLLLLIDLRMYYIYIYMITY